MIQPLTHPDDGKEAALTLAASRADSAPDGSAVVFVETDADDADDDIGVRWAVGCEADVPRSGAAGWRPLYRIKSI